MCDELEHRDKTRRRPETGETGTGAPRATLRYRWDRLAARAFIWQTPCAEHAGHNAYRFADDPWYADGFVPTVAQLMERLQTGQ